MGITIVLPDIITAISIFSKNKDYKFYAILSLLIFIFWPHNAACGILVPSPGMEPTPPVLEVQSLPGKSSQSFMLIF